VQSAECRVRTARPECEVRCPVRGRRLPVLLCAGAILAAGMLTASAQQQARPWTETFAPNLADLSPTGENGYFILKPGYALTLEGRENGTAVRLVVTVLKETKNVGGVETRVVEERETHAGALAEVSRNYFAIDKVTGDVYYFGEDVDTYRKGKIVNHEGAWHHGSNGAKFGLMMPGAPAVGMRFYQELAPGTAMDRAEIVSVSERLTTAAGRFEKCVKTDETTPLEPGAREQKVYAPGVGLVKDGTLTLTGISRQ
jgi:hypothetical protein